MVILGKLSMGHYATGKGVADKAGQAGAQEAKGGSA